MKKSGMICAWLPLDDLPIYSASLVFVHLRRHEGCSATRRRVCFAWSGVEKNRCGVCDALVRGIYDRKVHRVRDLSCGDARIYLEFELRRVWCRRCGAVKQERLPLLADTVAGMGNRWVFESEYTPDLHDLRCHVLKAISISEGRDRTNID